MKDTRKYSDRKDYLIKAVSNRRRILREKAIEYKGNKCEVCGYSKCKQALEFHHLDENKKDFGISEKGYSRSWDKIKTELDKCIMLCANCHRETHCKNNI